MSKVGKFYRKNKEEILDIILFGSVVKGKEKPADIDILVLYKSKVNLDLSYELKKDISDIGEIEIVSKTYSQLLESSFVAREAILNEGYSLVNKKFIYEGFGHSSFVLFKYDLKNLNKTKRMQFYYSLYGRTGKGLLQELDSYKFSENMILAPISQSEKMKEYLKKWVQFVEIPILMPSRLSEVLKK
ncbi:MAG: nucleotidyltransferase domain-containing protein [Nanoarchaeota archaeon]|nr:nucleotidyltransferase domain-containing protein [Nanoarchaeota archaeon]